MLVGVQIILTIQSETILYESSPRWLRLVTNRLHVHKIFAREFNSIMWASIGIQTRHCKFCTCTLYVWPMTCRWVNWLQYRVQYCRDDEMKFSFAVLWVTSCHYQFLCGSCIDCGFLFAFCQNELCSEWKSLHGLRELVLVSTSTIHLPRFQFSIYTCKRTLCIIIQNIGVHLRGQGPLTPLTKSRPPLNFNF